MKLKEKTSFFSTAVENVAAVERKQEKKKRKLRFPPPPSPSELPRVHVPRRGLQAIAGVDTGVLFLGNGERERELDEIKEEGATTANERTTKKKDSLSFPLSRARAGLQFK